MAYSEFCAMIVAEAIAEMEKDGWSVVEELRREQAEELVELGSDDEEEIDDHGDGEEAARALGEARIRNFD